MAHRVERLQNDEIKRAVKDVRLVGRHVLEAYSYDVLGVNALFMACRQRDSDQPFLRAK